MDRMAEKESVSVDTVKVWRNMLQTIKDMIKQDEDLFASPELEKMLDLASHTIGRNVKCYFENSNKLFVSVGKNNEYDVDWKTFCDVYELYGNIEIKERSNITTLANKEYDTRTREMDNLANFLLDSGMISDMQTKGDHELHIYVREPLQYIYANTEQNANLEDFVINRTEKDVDNGIVKSKNNYYLLTDINGELYKAGYCPLAYDNESRKFAPIATVHGEKGETFKSIEVLTYALKSAYGEEPIIFSEKVDTEVALKPILKGIDELFEAKGAVMSAYFDKIGEQIKSDFADAELEEQVAIPAYMVGRYIGAVHRDDIKDFAYGNEEKGIPACDRQDALGLIHWVEHMYPHYVINEHTYMEMKKEPKTQKMQEENEQDEYDDI